MWICFINWVKVSMDLTDFSFVFSSCRIRNRLNPLTYCRGNWKMWPSLYLTCHCKWDSYRERYRPISINKTTVYVHVFEQYILCYMLIGELLLSDAVLYRSLTGTATCCCLWSSACSSASSLALITAACPMGMSWQNLTHTYQTPTATAAPTGEPWDLHRFTQRLNVFYFSWV